MKKFVIAFLTVILVLNFLAQKGFSQTDANQIMDSKTIECSVSANNLDEYQEYHLKDIMEMARCNNIQIAISQDDLDEAEMKVDKVKDKKLALYFKLINANTLLKAEKYGLIASKYAYKATVNKVLLDAAKKYYAVLQALLAKQIAEESLEQGELLLKNNEELLKSGLVTKFELQQTILYLEQLKQEQMEADVKYMVASVDLAQFVNAKALTKRIKPAEIDLNESKEIKLNILNLVPAEYTMEKAVDDSLAIKPEIEELRFQLESLKKLNKATKSDDFKEIEIQTNIKKLKKTIKLTENTIKTVVAQSFMAVKTTKNQVYVAEQNYLLSKKSLDNVKIKREEGLSTTKDVLDAQVDLTKSKNALIGALVAHNMSQVNLLSQMGLLDLCVLDSNDPLVFEKLIEQKLKEREIICENVF